jgi:hypothetical protein
MSIDWGPHYIVPSEVLKSYSGAVMLREDLNEELLKKELTSLGITGPVTKIVNPWYYREKSSTTWLKIGESSDKENNFPARWDTTQIPNGKYEIMGLMHVFVRTGDTESAIARQNVVEVTVKN